MSERTVEDIRRDHKSIEGHLVEPLSAWYYDVNLLFLYAQQFEAENIRLADRFRRMDAEMGRLRKENDELLARISKATAGPGIDAPGNPWVVPTERITACPFCGRQQRWIAVAE